jgi:hypothetical protein
MIHGVGNPAPVYKLEGLVKNKGNEHNRYESIVVPHSQNSRQSITHKYNTTQIHTKTTYLFHKGFEDWNLKS